MPQNTPNPQLPTPNSRGSAALPARLRAAREAAGLSRRRLGDRLDVDGQTIYRWECGARTPNIDMLRRVAAALGVTAGSLLG